MKARINTQYPTTLTMAQTEKCLSCGDDLPSNFESLEACPACGADLWDDESGEDVINGKVIGAAVGAAILGVVIWAGIALGTEREFGWIAWGIGGLVGWATTKAGGAGMKAAVLAAVLTACSIGGGRVGTIKLVTGGIIQEYTTSEEFRDELLDLKVDAMDFAKLNGAVDDGVLIQFLTDHKYYASDDTQDFNDVYLANFRQVQIPLLEKLGTPTGEMDYLDDVRSDMAENLGVWKLLKEGSGIVDLLFLLLGIGTAFKLVLGRS